MPTSRDRRRPLPLWWSVSALALVLSLAGCSLFGPLPPDNRVNLAKTDLVGTWSHGPGSTIEFRSDGGFTAIGLPRDAFAGFTNVLPSSAPPTASIDAIGTWELGPSREDRTGPNNHIGLNITELMGRSSSGGLELTAIRRGSSVVLAFFLIDPDINDTYSYTRCGTAC
jgi:hypothetical protein